MLPIRPAPDVLLATMLELGQNFVPGRDPDAFAAFVKCAERLSARSLPASSAALGARGLLCPGYAHHPASVASPSFALAFRDAINALSSTAPADRVERDFGYVGVDGTGPNCHSVAPQRHLQARSQLCGRADEVVQGGQSVRTCKDRIRGLACRGTKNPRAVSSSGVRAWSA